MRTVFVNPASKRRTKKRRRSRKGGRRRSYHFKGAKLTGTIRRNAGITPFVSNPMILSNPRRRHRRRRNPSGFMGDLAWILGGSVGGAALNRLAFNHLNNFYIRNGARVVAASLLAYMGGKNPLTAAAAGATLAPIVPDVEMLMGSGVKKNPKELAAELSALLEADLSDGDELSDEYDLSDDDILSDDLEGVSEMTW